MSPPTSFSNVKRTGRDHVVGRAGVVEQRSDLEGMLDERRAVDPAALAGVQPLARILIAVLRSWAAPASAPHSGLGDRLATKSQI